MHLSFRRNLGNTDRVVRLIIGVIIFLLPSWFHTSTSWTWALYGLAVFDVVQAIAGY